MERGRDDTGARRRRELALALAVAALPFAWLVARWAFVCDDAFISFRYARHLAEGQGLRFNLGEDPPVEGYTNLLWVLWLASFEALGLAPTAVANATSIICGAVLVALTTRHAQQRLQLSSTSTIATALFLATLPSLSLWCTGGLETMPFALCVFASFDALARDPERPRGGLAGVFALLAALLRADGVLFAACAVATGAIALRGGAARKTRRACALALAILGVGVAAHLLWRHAYHGEWLPNTAKVKAGFSGMRLERGAKYVATMALNALGLPIALACAAATIARVRQRSFTMAAWIFVALAVVYSVFVGGDFMPLARFLVPALPFVALLFAAACAAWQASARGRLLVATATAAALVVAVLPAFDRLAVPRSWLDAVHFRWNSAEARTERERWRIMGDNVRMLSALGRGAAAHTRPGESLVLGNIGAFAYQNELFIHDVFGLVDREVAARTTEPRRLSPGHEKVVPPQFFVPRKPTYFGTHFAPAASPPDYGLPRDVGLLIGQGILMVEEHPPVPDAGVPGGQVQRFLRFDWSRATPRPQR